VQFLQSQFWFNELQFSLLEGILAGFVSTVEMGLAFSPHGPSVPLMTMGFVGQCAENGPFIL